MEEYDTLGDFLEHVSLVMDNDAADDTEKVTIMTIHAAKGLEFDYLFLPGWEEGVFPSQRALDEGGLDPLDSVTVGAEEACREAGYGLLLANADVHARDRHGRTALMWAALHRQEQAVVAGIEELQAIMRGAGCLDSAKTYEAADTVVDMDHEVVG